MRKIALLLLSCALPALPALGVRAATLASIRTTLGTMELELLDDDKPVTVSNFVKYVTSGEYTNQFIQRWDPNFVIQAGGFRVTNTATGLRISDLPTPFGMIKNEYRAGRIFSNTYGTIAMARRGGVVDSATSQWFLNLKDNAFLDQIDEGFTVFGRVLSGTNVLDLFIPRPPTNGIHLLNLGVAGLTELPVLKEDVTTIAELFDNLIYFEIKLRREMDLTVAAAASGLREIRWASVAAVTNTLEFSSPSAPGLWTVHTNIVGTGATVTALDASADPARIYRVAVRY